MAKGAHITRLAEAPDGTPFEVVRLKNGGAEATFLSWGASLQDFRLMGVAHSLVLGSSDPLAYLGPMRHFGAIVGPVANRIAGGRLIADGHLHQLELNDNALNCLHGGAHGFSKRNWSVADADATRVTFALHHAHGQGGFPANIEVQASYALEDDGALLLEITATPDRATWVSPAFHGYWNLDGSTDISGHHLHIAAQTYLPVDAAKIPLGAPVPVKGTAFDYTQMRTPEPELDHNFCLAREQGEMRPACVLEGGALRLEVDTTEVGLQVYSGRGVNTGPSVGHSGMPYGPNAGIAIEPQFWPDTPNHPDYPSSALRSGQTYRQMSRFRVTRL